MMKKGNVVLTVLNAMITYPLVPHFIPPSLSSTSHLRKLLQLSIFLFRSCFEAYEGIILQIYVFVL